MECKSGSHQLSIRGGIPLIVAMPFLKEKSHHRRYIINPPTFRYSYLRHPSYAGFFYWAVVSWKNREVARPFGRYMHTLAHFWSTSVFLILPSTREHNCCFSMLSMQFYLLLPRVPFSGDGYLTKKNRWWQSFPTSTPITGNEHGSPFRLFLRFHCTKIPSSNRWRRLYDIIAEVKSEFWLAQ